MIARGRLISALCVAACLISTACVPVAFAAAPAWSPVAATAPTVIPAQQSEVQRLFVDAEGGTFTLTALHQAATGLGDLNIGTVNKVKTTSGVFAIGQTIEGARIPPFTKITDVNAGAESLTLSQNGLGGPSSVQTTLTAYDAPETTSPLPYNASAAEVQSALEALPAVGVGNVTVSGGPGGHNAEDPYIIVFGGAMSNTNLAQLATDSAQLTGGQGASTVTTVQGGVGTSKLTLLVQNIGGAASTGTITYRATLPSGITTVGPPRAAEAGGNEWNCGGSTSTEILCTLTEGVAPNETPRLPVNAVVGAAPGTGNGDVELEVSGGGAPAATASLPLTVSATPAKPGVQSFNAGAYDQNGAPDERAGGHPYSASTALFVNTVRTVRGAVSPAGAPRNITVELPPGFLGNPVAVPACSEAVKAKHCPLDTMVGVVQTFHSTFGLAGTVTPVFNTEAPFGSPAKFRFEVSQLLPLNVIGTLRSDGDYGLDAASLNTPEASVFGVLFTFWGEPAAHSHDSSRCINRKTGLVCEASDVATDPKFANHNPAFLTNATNCAEQASIASANGGLLPTELKVTFWQYPGEEALTSAGIPPVTGCDQLHFEDNFTFEPSGTKADSTASFKSSLTVPEEGLTDPTKLTTPELNDIVVQLPKGVVLNASGADGLQACSEQQIGFMGGNFPMPNPMRFNKDPNTCPEASKIGTGELKTALLEDPLHGALYLAAQGEGNPFGSLFAIYLVIEDPRHGIFIKLPGEVEPDPQTGQMTVTFENLPQLPFTSLNLSLKGGNRSALASPTTCGEYTTTATGTPWSAPESGPPTVTGQSFEINQGPDGGPCAKTPQDRPFDLGWSAGAEGNQAGASGPFDFRITRPDGSQELESLELKTPKGVSASLKGIPYCSEAQIHQAEGSTGKQEQSNPACPAASQVGTLTTGAGSGPTPFYVSGKAYLAGPYKGAPVSVVAITPAVAGPFDLGNVVVRSAVYIDRTTAQVRAVTDQIPLFLKGVGLRIRDVRIHLDRKDWTINPTSCEAMSVDLTAHGNSGATASRSARFQVGGCDKLAFKPRLRAHLKGGTRRGKHPAFTAELTYPEGPGYANIKDVQVTIPHSEFLEQAHINTICTRPQAAAHQCPAGSIYGYAEAETPLLDGKLRGPVFLKSSDHQLPDLAIALRGPDSQPVEVEFQGRIDSIKGQIRNTIEGLPDVPVSKFVLRMKGGKKGLLVNSRNLCAGKVTRMTVDMTAQNNRTSSSRPPLKRKCGRAKKAKRRHHRRSRPSKLFGVW